MADAIILEPSEVSSIPLSTGLSLDINAIGQRTQPSLRNAKIATRNRRDINRIKRNLRRNSLNGFVKALNNQPLTSLIECACD